MSGKFTFAKDGDVLIAALAAGLFVPLFIFRSFGPLDFWWGMSANLVLLIGVGAAIDHGYIPSLALDLKSGLGRKIFLGAVSAAALYAFYFVGNGMVRQVFSFAGTGITGVYEYKSGASLSRIVLLLTLVIGPGEELFWRGFLQRRWQVRFGAVPGLLAAAALYTLVHLGSGNPILILAAAVCGLFWGALYLRTGSILLVAVSHILWDLAVFIFFPFS